ncbi:hypothetical protein BD309DRAFT_1085243 [Dichomitus squalens]|nr:hypothetical protein BD309DRAFT_1085243 [Dichomitus squalens]
MAPSRRLRLLVPSLFEFPKHLELFPNLLTSLGSDDECATSTSRAQQILSAASITAAEDIPFRQERPRPAQGGERISEGFLMRLGRSECLWRFRFAADELIELAAALRLPPIFRTPASGYAVPRLEAITLTCARLARPGDIYDLVKEYDRSAAAISEIVNHTICLIDVAWAHLLDFDHNHLLAPQRLSEYASAIRNAGAPMSTVWGFIDCTLRRISRPTWFQRAAYSGYKKYHALKYQAVMIPNVVR